MILEMFLLANYPEMHERRGQRVHPESDDNPRKSDCQTEPNGRGNTSGVSRDPANDGGGVIHPSQPPPINF